jgi:hypothetical protein
LGCESKQVKSNNNTDCSKVGIRRFYFECFPTCTLSLHFYKNVGLLCIQFHKVDPLCWQPPFKKASFTPNENSKPIPIPRDDYIKILGHKCCFCSTNIHLLKRLVHVKFRTFSYDKRIHLCSFLISLKYRNVLNRVYNLCHEVHSKNRSTAKPEVPLHHMASHNENRLFIYLLGTLPLPLFRPPCSYK